MKKYIILISLVLTTSVLAQRSRLKHEKMGVAGKIGVSLFDGDIPSQSSSFLSPADVNIAVGGAFDYYFVPQAGVILEYLYTPISVNLPNFKFSGEVHSTAFYFSLNVLNIINPHRIPKWNVYINPGFGLSFYHSESIISPYAPPRKLENEICVTYPVELAVEYNFNHWWAVLWGMQYRFQSKDNFEAMRDKQGNSNDGLYITTFSLKYKFHKRPKSSYGTNYCR